MTKNIYNFWKYTFSNLSYLTTWASTTNYITYFSDILFGLKSAWSRIYKGVAGQGLNNQISQIFINIFCHLKLEIVVAIPSL